MIDWFRIIFCCLVVNVVHAQSYQDYEKKIAIAYDEANSGNHAKSIQALESIQKIANHNKWYKLEFLTQKHIAYNHFLLLDYTNALTHYTTAYQIATEFLTEIEEVNALNNIGVLYLREKKFSEAETYFLKSLEIVMHYDELKNEKIIHFINLSSIAIEENNLNKAQKYLSKLSQEINTKSEYFYHYKVIESEVSLMQKNYAKAKRVALEIIPNLESKLQYENLLLSYLVLAKAAFQQNNIEESIKYLRFIIDHPDTTLEHVSQAYDLLTKAYINQNHLNLALQAKDSLMAIRQRMDQNNLTKKFENQQLKFELLHQKTETNRLLEVKNFTQKIYIILIFCLIILTIFVLIIYRNQRIRSLQKQKIIQLELEKQMSEKKFLELKINEQTQENIISLEKLKREIDYKNRQIAVKALSNTAKNEMLENLIQEISKDKEISNNTNYSKLLISLKNHLKSDSNWEEYFSHFEKVNQKFIINLKQFHPTLNANDLRFISYLYMNLTTKEIATLLNITLEACRKRKERIAKKLNLTDSTDLHQYLIELENKTHNYLICN